MLCLLIPAHKYMNQPTLRCPVPAPFKVHNCAYWRFSALLCLFCLGSAKTLHAADFTVTTPGFFYSINANSPNPTLTLVRGKTYTFAVNAGPTHPLLINSAGVVNNNIAQGTITFTVPNVASNYTYICSIHGFGGQILTVAPPPPPAPPKIRILSLNVSSNLVLLSTGTNTWSVLPEYSTNVIGTNWFALTVVSNFFSQGTNETFCGLPPSNPAFIRIRSQPQ
jgi:hypothetical protein